MGGRLNIQCFFDLVVGTRSDLPSLAGQGTHCGLIEIGVSAQEV